MKIYILNTGRKTERCRRCAAEIVFLYTKNQKPIPVNAATVKDGAVDFDPEKGHVVHFITCKARKRFKRRPKQTAPPAVRIVAQQAELFV